MVSKSNLQKDQQPDLLNESLLESDLLISEYRQDRSDDGGPEPDAPAALQRDRSVQLGVREHAPETLTVTKLGEQLRTASYTVDGKKAERTEHSKSMQKIFESVEAMDLFLDFPVILSKEDFAGQLAAMEDRYHHLIADCAEYIDTHNPWTKEGKVRKKKVEEIRAMASEELLHLKSNADAFLEEQQGQAESRKTWRDVIAFSRTQKFRDGEDGVQLSRTGGNTSVVHVITKGEKKTFFKKREKIEPESFQRSYDEFQGKYATIRTRLEDPDDPDYKKLQPGQKTALLAQVQEKAAVAESLEKYIKKRKFSQADVRGLFSLVLGKGVSILPTLTQKYPGLDETLFYQKLMEQQPVYLAHRQRLEALKAEVKALQNAVPPNHDLIAAKRKEWRLADADKSAVETTIGVMKELNTTMLASRVAREGPEIETGRDLSTRNVATSRLAEFLGIGDCVVRCEMARVQIGDEKMDGVAMEQAKGTEMGAIRIDQKKRKGRYTVNAAKQMLALQVFDVICGQLDRHPGNYLAEAQIRGDSYTITGITGIDSDMSFGLMTYDRMRENPTDLGSMRFIEDEKGNLTLPAMSEDLAHQIMALEPRMLRYLLGDILNAREMAALTSRLRGVQQAITRKMDEEDRERAKQEKLPADKRVPVVSVFKKDDAEWEQFLAEAAQNKAVIAKKTYLEEGALN
ncbi:MAG: hypothetical protein K6B72_05495 [Lachnospiraceae bacterium]|nr:hypothetical protein [Lachnospiraceae bacterium]